ncbi:Haloacid dehalogenase-like hydrolase domain-containing protein [Thalictrum thalictroides]|uniref:Haloacid dehalogenase-like hydrolase domain-containing protein n=1 Tax=Thalictrum thalictroides TaxID=46969 RepID=A0A7J6X1U1_THATH|nr:Haloacid dehalogenase-like hydrolase domain-containing protein [Thalictrum thalictroides]
MASSIIGSGTSGVAHLMMNNNSISSCSSSITISSSMVMVMVKSWNATNVRKNRVGIIRRRRSSRRRIVVNCASSGVPTTNTTSSDSDSDSEPDLAILLEVHGVLMDVYRWGNRQAFNLAFQKLGLDCANWTEPIYLDLVRKASGDEERMLMLFFNRIGWPTSLPTNEKESFMKSVMREKRNALAEFVTTKSLPLRPGLEEFIDDALAGGIPIIILTAYCEDADNMTRPIVEKLGQDRLSRIKIVGKEEVERSFYGQLVLGKSASSGLDEQLANEVRKAANAEKLKVAKEVASMLKVSVDIGTGTTGSLDRIVAALRAGAEYAGVRVENCVLIAGSQSGLLGAERIGMPSVILRSSMTSRTEFPLAAATMDGFGGADLTVSKCIKTYNN